MPKYKLLGSSVPWPMLIPDLCCPSLASLWESSPFRVDTLPVCEAPVTFSMGLLELPVGTWPPLQDCNGRDH